VTLPREDPPPTADADPAPVVPVRPAAVHPAAMPSGPARPPAKQPTAMQRPGGPPAADHPAAAPAVHVEDHLDPRVRLPADLLRCVIALIEIALVAGLGLLARATADGAEIDIVKASNILPGAMLSFLGFAAHAALLILPVALAVRLLIRRQPRRLAEGVAAGGLAVGVVLVLNQLLRSPVADGLYDVLTAIHHADKSVPALDWYLSGLTAYVTVIGLSGRPRWRTIFWLAIAFYGVASLAVHQTTLFSLLITVLLGRACGAGLRYAFGAISERPSAEEIAEALSAVEAPVVAMRRIVDSSAETRKYAATLQGGGRLDVTVFDREQQAADAFYRLYRRLRLTTQVSRSAPLTVERAIERRALMTYATEDAGVPTPRLRALVRVGPEASAIANESHDGTTLAGLAQPPTDTELAQVWDVVLRLHSRRVTHRALTADRILLTSDGHDRGGGDDQASGLGPPYQDGARPGNGGEEVMLLEPGNGDVAASDLQLRLDLAQLVAELALLVGPDRAAASARAKLSADELAAVVPLIQPVVLYRSTRIAASRHRDVLPALRKGLVAAAPGPEGPPVQVERIRLRTLLTMVAAVFAAYILAVDLTKTSFSQALHEADWRWGAVALLLSALTYLGATWALSGFVLERLRFVQTFLTQVACSFVTLVTPAAVGGVALNLRYLRKRNLTSTDAVASIGASQVIAFTLHLTLLVIFIAIAGSSHDTSLRPPDWTYYALGVLVSVALVVLAVPAGRKLLLSRLTSTLSQVIPRLLDLAQQPAKLAEGIGGTLLVDFAYISCLAVSVRAFGGSLPFATVAVVYLTGSAIGSAVPTPGGLGAVEAALSAGLTAAGLHGTVAFSAVLLFRTITFWLPVPLGWAALNYLQHRDIL
jgi:glycosyltransferase 2 family protein